jgi:hypothetical protein
MIAIEAKVRGAELKSRNGGILKLPAQKNNLARIARIARLAAGTGVFALAFVFNSEIRAIRAKIISVPKSSHHLQNAVGKRNLGVSKVNHRIIGET